MVHHLRVFLSLVSLSRSSASSLLWKLRLPPSSQEVQLGEHVPGVVALPAADAGRDPLHLPAHAGRALAPELQGARAGGVGHAAAAAAAAAAAQAAVGGPQPLGAAAPRQDQPLRALRRDLGPARLPLGGLGVTQGSHRGHARGHATGLTQSRLWVCSGLALMTLGLMDPSRDHWPVSHGANV